MDREALEAGPFFAAPERAADAPALEKPRRPPPVVHEDTRSSC